MAGLGRSESLWVRRFNSALVFSKLANYPPACFLELDSGPRNSTVPSLFIRPYPAKGSQIVPATFKAAVWGYFAVCLLPLAAFLFFSNISRSAEQRPVWALAGATLSLLGLLIAVA